MKKIIKIILMLLILLLLFRIGEWFYWWTAGFIYPDMWMQLRAEYRQKPTEYLLKKLNSFSFQMAEKAQDVLVERKEKRAVPKILKFLNSPIKYKRDSAMRALAIMGDESAILPLMKIIKKCKKHPDYFDALHTLSALHYEPIYPLVLELAHLNPIQDSKEDYRSSGVTMLENFPNKPETLPTLKKIADTDPEEYIREKAKKAIKHIESLQKNSGKTAFK